MMCVTQDCYLAYALTEMAGSTVMIFTRTCESTRKIALTLRNLGFGAIPIHGQMSQPKRLGALNKFKVISRSPYSGWWRMVNLARNLTGCLACRAVLLCSDSTVKLHRRPSLSHM